MATETRMPTVSLSFLIAFGASTVAALKCFTDVNKFSFGRNNTML